ncbi:MAG: RNA 2',3'-cyclic phosphodiesterase [Candidatus Helarchaeota archaeon]
MIRSFIAIDLEEEETRKNIQEFGKILKNIQPGIKLVEPENLHMTIKFLGNIPDSLAPKIYNVLKEEINEKIFQGITREYYLKGTGQFRNYSVIWVKLIGDISFLQSIKTRVEDLLKRKFNLEKDKRGEFNPHLTIGRLNRKKINHGTFEKFKMIISENKEKEFGHFHVDTIKLKKSVLTPKGPIYSTLVF